MSEKKTAVPAAPAAEVPASEPKTRKASGTPARRGRPPLTPEVYVEYGGNQYNITDVVKNACGTFDPHYYTDYLTRKFSELYGL